MYLDLLFSPAYHGAMGIWDEVISWGVFLLVAVVVGAFFYQQWRERDEEEDDLTALEDRDPRDEGDAT